MLSTLTPINGPKKYIWYLGLFHPEISGIITYGPLLIIRGSSSCDPLLVGGFNVDLFGEVGDLRWEPDRSIHPFITSWWLNFNPYE